MIKKVGITGQNGFIGFHLLECLRCFPQEFEAIDFQRKFWTSNVELDSFVQKCDVIIHLAAINRHENLEQLYQTNINLTHSLIDSLYRTNSRAHIIVSSSTQEENDNLYGVSKMKSRLLLSNWANATGSNFSGLIIPNVFGPFCKPFYNSVVSTFCYQIVNGFKPKIDIDNLLNLIYVGDLAHEIIELIRISHNSHCYNVKARDLKKVSEILTDLNYFKEEYLENSSIPILDTSYKLQLFNTFRSYIDLKSFFPRYFRIHTDLRGEFVEVIRHGISGQSSYSTTVPGVTRGNHFHTRKIERFAVVKGKAKIQMRKVGDDEVLEFELDGNNPSFVDIPIWYTHNISNIGVEELLTMFWINEPYDSNDPDTYLKIV